MHYINKSDFDHPYPLWRLVNPHEEALRGDTFNDTVWTSSRPCKETWLCNHCTDYPAPSPSTFGRIVKSRWDVSWHIQTEYVRLLVIIFEGLRFDFWYPGTRSITQWLTWIYSHIRCLYNISVGVYQWAQDYGMKGTLYVFIVCGINCIFVLACCDGGKVYVVSLTPKRTALSWLADHVAFGSYFGELRTQAMISSSLIAATLQVDPHA